MASVAYRWDVEAFLRAHDAEVFRTRVELVDGEVWPVVIGDWHGQTTFRVAAALSGQGVLSAATLATGPSLPDPDVWVRDPGATAVDVVSARLSRWDPAGVRLVVEVSDETEQADLTTKARVYGSAGYRRYWVVTRDGVHVHTDPVADGYATVRFVSADGSVELPDGSAVRVGALLEH